MFFIIITTISYPAIAAGVAVSGNDFTPGNTWTINQRICMGALWPLAILVSTTLGILEFWQDRQDRLALREEKRRLKLEREYKRIADELEGDQ